MGLLDEPAMCALAAEFAANLRPPLIVYLYGDLGAGKTTFVRAVLRQLGYEGRVKSPTYGLLECYLLEHLQIVHIDLYRISHPGELEFLGLDEFHLPQSVFMIEWPERGAQLLPKPDLSIEFSHASEARELIFTFHNSTTSEMFNKLANYLQ
ncbi:MAG: tRNA threonylcarbamoyladenosine biosynthesis protein TsaE [Lysobacterales bacterium]|jgi:tRNA threonylcarbamoyladenosine biosynthesis protein TsaE